MNLRPYQELAIAHTSRAAFSPGSRVYFTLPTGTGKTVILSRLTQRYNRALVIAHRNELIEQLAGRLRQDWGDSEVGIVKAERNEAANRLVVGTSQTLRPERVRGVMSYGQVDALFVDECFPAGTLVDGRPIETWQPGMPITTWDESCQAITTSATG